MTTFTDLKDATEALPPEEPPSASLRPPASRNYAEWLANLQALQRSLNLDEQKVRAWQQAVRDARR